MKLTIGLLLLLLVSSCKVEKEVTTTNDAKLEKVKSPRSLAITAIIGEKDPNNSENFVVKDLSIEGNTMIIEISYLGGCAEHSFKMIGLPIPSASLQPIRTVQLVHIANNDECKEEKKVTLEVDISALAAQKEDGKKTELVMDWWNNKIDYIYSNK
jgi:hypothetical protein